MQIANEMLATTTATQRAALRSDDSLLAAQTLFEIIEGIPPLSSQVKPRSRWLAVLSGLLADSSVEWPLGHEVRLLAAVAQTAFAARETTSALTASEQAIGRAIELGDHGLEALVRARRLAWLCLIDPGEAAAEAQALDTVWQRTPEAHRSNDLLAEVHLGWTAWYGAQREYNAMRKAMASLGRLQLPQDGRIHYVAFATQCALAQLALRTRMRVQAAQSMIDAARIAADFEADAALANLQAALAAFAVRAGDFDAAISHASSALDAAQACQATKLQLDPWFGMPFDIAPEQDLAGIIRHLAEAALTAQEAGDRTGFLVSATGMVSFYLLADRAPEALDAMNEAIEAVQEMNDEHASKMLRGVAEGLLRYMGMLA